MLRRFEVLAERAGLRGVPMRSVRPLSELRRPRRGRRPRPVTQLRQRAQELGLTLLTEKAEDGTVQLVFEAH